MRVRSPLLVFIACATLWTFGADAPPAAIDAAASHTRIVLIQPGKNADRPPILALSNPVSTKDAAKLEDTYQGILGRELIRQALLIAARDELGLATRDEVLGDEIGADARDKAASTVELITVQHTVEGKSSPALIRRGDAASAQTLFQRDLAGANISVRDPWCPVELAESWSRSEFPNVLRQLGLGGKPNVIQPDAPLPADVEDRLTQLDYIGVFAAIRDLHDAMRKSGESPRRIGALVRAYSLMGVLSEHHWHPAHKVFKARALLYAQRLVARAPDDSHALWHRAFALALTGLHRRAQDDIQLARARAGAENRPSPAWADLIEACAHYNIARMNVNPGPLAPLAALLRLMVVEYPVMTDLTLLAAKEVVTLAPECYRAYDSMCRVGGVSNLHDATTAGPANFARSLKQKLLAVEALPNSIRAHVENPEGDDTTIWKLLSQAGEPGADAGEPSWAVLGRLFRETQFVHVFRRLNFMRHGWGVPVRDYWLRAVTAVADHPYRQYLETMVWPPDKASQSLINLIEHLDVVNLELSSYPMLKVIFESQHPQKLVAWNFAVRHLDSNAHDLSAVVEYSDGTARCAHAQRLLEYSPDCPYAKATLIEHDWEVAKPHITEWERDANRSPAILAALARRYSQIGKYDEAQHALVRYIRFSPDYWAYEQIAKNFRERGDLEHWQSTLEEFLAKTPDHGLTHAQVSVQLANHFMEQKQWEMATHFADLAAESGAQWAMVCAERCAEGRKDWARAEEYARQISQRYPRGWARWFLFCKRTGQGDLQSAQAFAEKHVLPDDDRPEVPGPAAVGYFYWLTGDTKRAMIWFKKAHQAKPTANTCFNLILLGDELGDTDTRDEALRVLLSRFRKPFPRVCQIFEILRGSFYDPARPPNIDLKAIDKIIQPMAPSARGLNAWLVGLYLKNHGKPEDARRFLQQAVELHAVHDWAEIIAADALRKLGDVHKNEKHAESTNK